MAVSFPLSPQPTAYYATNQHPQARNNVFYVGDTVTFEWVNNLGHVVQATGYTVRDYWGNIVSQGSMTPNEPLNHTPTPPDGGWEPGWYRIYITGPTNDALFGFSVGATNFCVIRRDSRFPTMPPDGTYGGAGGEARDLVMKGVMGIGTSRLQVTNVPTPNAPGADTLAVCQTDAAVGAAYWSNPSVGVDPARPRYLFAQLPNGTVDSIFIQASGGGTQYLRVFCVNGTLDGSKVFVKVDPGTVLGTKITVCYPDAVTVVETYDNLPDNFKAVSLINGVSAYIYVWVVNGTLKTAAATMAATAIGNTFFNGVKTIVSTLYPLGVTHYEGYRNEPTDDAQHHQMRLFQAAVHAGNASAKAIGPCYVSMDPAVYWNTFLTAGGGAYCDEFSTHAYSAPIEGNWMVGRTNFQAWRDALTRFGYGSKPFWQTEATQAICTGTGVYHPRRGRLSIMLTLFWEQYGLPREKNPVWYDISHGFWFFPAFLEFQDTSLNPQCVMYRVLAEETFGQTHAEILDFGRLGNNVFLGSRYAGAGGDATLVIASFSAMPDSTVTLQVAGATHLTVVDAFGKVSSVSVQDGLAVVAVTENPSYVKLPAGATASVYTCNDWPAINVDGQGTDSTLLMRGSGATVGGAATNIPISQFSQGAFALSSGQITAFSQAGSPPDTAVLSWQKATRVDRVVIWAHDLLDFDVQTSVDGTNWVTQATVTKTASSFLHGTGSENAGTQRETFYDDQWIWDVPLPEPVTCKAVRLYVRSTLYAGEPDAAAATAAGASGQQLQVNEIACVCDDNTEQAVVLA